MFSEMENNDFRNQIKSKMLFLESGHMLMGRGKRVGAEDERERES